jgi:N-acetyl-gamma-glutamyl-phosphate reductase
MSNNRMKKIFIDGAEGTTGLRIHERLAGREDIRLLRLLEETRKDPDARREMLNTCDIAFLCLPDAAAREAVAMVENPAVRIIDASTAHRTAPGWVYGFPELCPSQADAIAAAKRVANPGCYATGFISLVRPLVQHGILPADAPLCCHALSGYTGAGKKTIAVYEAQERDAELDSPRQYGLTLCHKHIPEMMAMTGLTVKPIFSPIICDFPRGMSVTVPLFLTQLGIPDFEALRQIYQEHYAGQALITVHGAGEPGSGFIGSNNMAGRDSLEIFVSGNAEQAIVTARFDNLGKGASGAAIQCMNIMLGADPVLGLDL